MLRLIKALDGDDRAFMESIKHEVSENDIQSYLPIITSIEVKMVSLHDIRAVHLCRFINLMIFMNPTKKLQKFNNSF